MDEVSMQNLIGMCRSLAYRYNSPNHFDDMVSEGVLECLEQINSGNTHSANLRRMANRAMHDYLNLKTLPVKVPVTTATRAIAREKQETTKSGNIYVDTTYYHPHKSTYSKEGILKLQQAIKSTSLPFNHHLAGDVTVDVTSDPATMYERKVFLEQVVKVARKALNDEEWKLLSRHYLEDEPLEQIATSEGVSRQAIDKRVKNCVNKITVAIKLVDLG